MRSEEEIVESIKNLRREIDKIESTGVSKSTQLQVTRSMHNTIDLLLWVLDKEADEVV